MIKTKKKINAILTSSTLEITFTSDASTASIARSVTNFPSFIEALNDDDEKTLRTLVDAASRIRSVNGNIRIDGENVFYKDHQIHGTFVDRLLEYSGLKLETTAIIAFIEKLMVNPSFKVIEHLYTFLEYGKLPLTETGNFLAYKVVRHNYLDKHSGTMDNSVGKVVEMSRNMVDDERDNTCSNGLHFCSFEYVKHFLASSGDRIVLVEVNPTDVVAIPRDYNNTKARCCKYTVVADVTDQMTYGTKPAKVMTQTFVRDGWSN